MHNATQFYIFPSVFIAHGTMLNTHGLKAACLNSLVVNDCNIVTGAQPASMVKATTLGVQLHCM